MDYLDKIKAQAGFEKSEPVKVQNGEKGAYLKAIQAQAAEKQPRNKGKGELKCQLSLNP